MTGVILACVLLGLLLMQRDVKASDAWVVPGAPHVLAHHVSFKNGDARLDGTLYLPATGEHLAAVVVLHDAGIPTRDGKLYDHLRSALPAIGIAVLIYDRRGTGLSTGSSRVSYETLADDAIAGSRVVQESPRIDPHRIGYWGLSQGGWLAVIAAARDANAAFAVSISAPITTPARQMEFATSNRLRLRGYSARSVAQMLRARRTYYDFLRGTQSRSAALKALTLAKKQPWFGISYLPDPANLTADPRYSAARSQIDEDITSAIRAIKVPMLFIFGGKDPWVPVAASVERLRALAKEKPRLQYVVVPNADHTMMFRNRDDMRDDRETFYHQAPQSPVYFMVLGSWLSEVTRE
jgi:hypothetical protein